MGKLKYKRIKQVEVAVPVAAAPTEPAPVTPTEVVNVASLLERLEALEKAASEKSRLSGVSMPLELRHKIDHLRYKLNKGEINADIVNAVKSL